jgi:hypothetical protein
MIEIKENIKNTLINFLLNNVYASKFYKTISDEE